MKQKPEESIRIYSAGMLLTQVNILASEIGGVRAGKDIEAVHRTRVSSRRLRAILDVFEDCLPSKRGIIWQQQVKKLTRALGSARDTDVQIVTVSELAKTLDDHSGLPGLRRLLLRLNQKRTKLQTLVLDRLEEFESSGVVEEIRAASDGLVTKSQDVYLYTPALYRRSFDRIRAGYEAFRSYEDSIRSPENIKDLHAMRIAGKIFRYTMECFAPLYSHELKQPMAIMKTAQEYLGSIHDCDVWIMDLPNFLDEERKRTIAYFGHDRYAVRFEPGIQYLLNDRQKNRNDLYGMYIEKWDLWKTEKVWDNLLLMLQVPFLAEKEVTPLSLIKKIKNGGVQ